MFGLGVPELLVIFVIALIVFGPKKLPELGKSIGRAMSEFKKAQQEFQESVRSEMKDVEKNVELDEIKKLGKLDHPSYHSAEADKQADSTAGAPSEAAAADQKQDKAKGGEAAGNG